MFHHLIRRTTILALMVSPCTYAENVKQDVVFATGQRGFGPNETQTSACELALAEARINAMQALFGVIVGQRTDVVCGDQNYEATGECNFNENSWSFINNNGYITEIRDLIHEVSFSPQLKSSICKVSGNFVIQPFKGKLDPAFETSVRTSRGRILSSQDSLSLILTSNKEAYHYLYTWEQRSNQTFYYRLFPNAVDQQTVATKELTVPSPNAMRHYEIDISIQPSERYAIEHLILVSAKNELTDGPESGTEATFYRWLASHQRNSWTQDKITLQIIGESQ